MISDHDHIEEIISNNRADMVALGRELLRNPYLVLDMAHKNDIKYSPVQYERRFYLKQY